MTLAKSIVWVGAAMFSGLALMPQARATTHTVLIEGMKFVPESLSVRAGDTVIWKNQDFFPHTATSEKKAFDSKGIAAGSSWKLVVKKLSGEFPYVCAFHPTMRGTLVVERKR